MLKYYWKLTSIGSLAFSVGHNLQLVLFVGISVIFIEQIFRTSRHTQRLQLFNYLKFITLLIQLLTKVKCKKMKFERKMGIDKSVKQ